MRLGRGRAPLLSIAAVGFVAFSLAVISAAGCSFEPECGLTNDCNRCDPSLSADIVGDDCGFFVSRSSGDDTNDGSKARPLRTLDRAISLAGEKTNNVYACADEFEEAVHLPSGVKLFGGLDCEGGWAFAGGARKTTITAPAGQIALTLGGGERTTRVEHVVVRAPSATEPGGSSIAVLALQGAIVEILESDLVAGDGASGSPGASSDAASAKSGIAGGDGGAACEETDGIGGEEPEMNCGGTFSRGGKGGSGFYNHAGDGTDGVPALEGTGLGGSGQSSAASCQAGTPGADGDRGADGEGGKGMGTLSASGFRGQPGEDGNRGYPGQGGGGGGGSRSAALCPFGAGAENGAGGGAGGTGGCGGLGGKGGGFGGASIALASVFATVTLDAVNVRTGRGGDGGSGGPAQLGGVGGFGGKGGASKGEVSGGCDGGPGGRGGDGGFGGGGLGGPSIGIAFVGAAPTQSRVTFELGKGGRGGIAPTVSGAGDDGIVTNALELVRTNP
jgi:hypothetical protein